MTSLSSLENVLNHFDDYWNLKIVGDSIQEASFFEGLFEWVRSFFTSDHLLSLKDKATELFKRDITPTSEKEIATVEKLARVIDSHSKGWLYGVEHSLPKPKPIEVERSFVPSENLLKPINEEGYFVNYLGESVFWQFCETMRLLFPGMFSPSTHLKSVESLCQREQVQARSEESSFTWIGHSTLLFQLNGMNLLFDPAFGFCPPCFKRHTKPGIELKDLPLIDAIFLSHNHADHCEPFAVNHLSKYQPFVFTPEKFKGWFEDKGYKNASDMSWWQKATLKRDNKEISITSVPAFHNSQTSLTDANYSHWHGCVIEFDDQKIYFAGDTAYNEELFDQLKNQYGSFDLVFMPIGPECERSVHVDVEQALTAFRRLDAKEMVPIHYGAYRQGKEVLEDPLNRLKKHLETDFQDLKDKISLPKIGQLNTFKVLTQESTWGNKNVASG